VAAASMAAAAADGTPEDDSPTRRHRNKRKMTEPRRRATDFSIRSLCSASNSDVEREDDDDEEDDGAVMKINRATNTGSMDSLKSSESVPGSPRTSDRGTSFCHYLVLVGRKSETLDNRSHDKFTSRLFF